MCWPASGRLMLRNLLDVGISAVRHPLSERAELPEHVGRVLWIADVEKMKKLEEGRRYAGDKIVALLEMLLVVVAMLIYM